MYLTVYTQWDATQLHFVVTRSQDALYVRALRVRAHRKRSQRERATTESRTCVLDIVRLRSKCKWHTPSSVPTVFHAERFAGFSSYKRGNWGNSSPAEIQALFFMASAKLTAFCSVKYTLLTARLHSESSSLVPEHLYVLQGVCCASVCVCYFSTVGLWWWEWQENLLCFFL